MSAYTDGAMLEPFQREEPSVLPLAGGLETLAAPLSVDIDITCISPPSHDRHRPRAQRFASLVNVLSRRRTHAHSAYHAAAIYTAASTKVSSAAKHNTREERRRCRPLLIPRHRCIGRHSDKCPHAEEPAITMAGQGIVSAQSIEAPMTSVRY